MPSFSTIVLFFLAGYIPCFIMLMIELKKERFQKTGSFELQDGEDPDFLVALVMSVCWIFLLLGFIFKTIRKLFEAIAFKLAK